MNRLLRVFWLVAVAHLSLGASAGEAEHRVIETARQLLSLPAGEVEIRMRITIRPVSGPVMSQHLVMAISRPPREASISVTAGTMRSTFCLRCADAPTQMNCEGGDAVRIDGLLPGTHFPWIEIVERICAGQRVSLSMDRGEGPLVVRVNGRGSHSLLYFDEQANPVHIERYSAKGRLLGTLKVLETRRTPWGVVITRSLWSSPDNDGEVLAEVLSGASIPDQLNSR